MKIWFYNDGPWYPFMSTKISSLTSLRSMWTKRNHRRSLSLTKNLRKEREKDRTLKVYTSEFKEILSFCHVGPVVFTGTGITFTYDR